MPVNAVWLHQFDRAGITSFKDMHATWLGNIYIKAIDGEFYMDRFDHSGLAIGVDTNWELPTYDLVIPWTVPTHHTDMQVWAHNKLLAQTSKVILDLEPYEGFWRDAIDDLDHFIDALDDCKSNLDYHWPGEVSISLDHRRVPDGFPSEYALKRATRILPQVYWTTFQRPWREVCEEALAILEPINPSIEFVFPGDSAPNDLIDALAWSILIGRDVSIWVWQTITPENWAIIKQFSTHQLVGSKLREALDLLEMKSQARWL